jgi:hypothetical protein
MAEPIDEEFRISIVESIMKYHALRQFNVSIANRFLRYVFISALDFFPKINSNQQNAYINSMIRILQTYPIPIAFIEWARELIQSYLNPIHAPTTIVDDTSIETTTKNF